MCVCFCVWYASASNTQIYKKRFQHLFRRFQKDIFNTRIPVRGDNELSDIAMQVNHMAEEIEQLLEKRKAGRGDKK